MMTGFRINPVSSFLPDIKRRIDSMNPLFLSAVLFLVFLLFLLSSYSSAPAKNIDVAEYLNNPLRVINGDMPYRDFWLLFPPGEVFLPALFYKTFGLNINIVLLFSVFINALMGLFSFVLGRAVFKDNFFSLITALLVFFNGIAAHYGRYVYPQVYFLLLLISALFMLRFFEDSSDRKLFLSGIFTGLAFLFRFYEVGTFLAAFFVTFLVYLRINRVRAGRVIKLISVFCTGVFLVVGAASLALIEIQQVMVKEVVFESVSHAVSFKMTYQLFDDVLKQSKNVLAGLGGIAGGSDVIRNITDIFYYAGSIVNGLLIYVLHFIVLGVSAWYLLGRRLKGSGRLITIFFLLWGMFMFLRTFQQPAMYNLGKSVSPLFFLLIFLLKENSEYHGELHRPVSLKFIRYVLAASTVILVTAVPVRLYQAGYATLAEPSYEVRTEYGKLVLSDEAGARDIKDIINYINKNTDKDDYIFVTPWYAPPFYALTNRKNPTYYDSLIDVVARPGYEKQMKICNDLLEKKTKLIVHYKKWGFRNRKKLQFQNACGVLQKCIDENYEIVERFENSDWRRYWIYAKKGI